MTDQKTRSSTAIKSAMRLTGGLVRILDGADRGRTLELDREPVVIGSAGDCDLVLRDRKVSRRHLEVGLGRFGFLVKDLGSTNGTVFERSHLSEASVPPGAILKLGNTHVVLMASSEREKLELSTRSSFGALVGAAAPMRRVYAMLERAASSDTPILLLGETGTGKELAARALHDQSRRARGPFEVFDCGAVAAGLLASDLFGHEQGAFTGAVAARPGVFERAASGTVFIDEVGELPLDLQPSLLRVCDRAEVTRVGSGLRIGVDVRIIAATRRDLASEVVAGRFREDLFYRLAVLPITLPPLRARIADLPILCQRLLAGLGVSAPGPIDGPGLGLLAAHRWPGNVRELRNLLERAIVRAGGPVAFRELSFEVPRLEAPAGASVPDADFQTRKKEAIARFERDFLAELLEAHDGNILRASQASGIERTQLKRMLRRNRLL